MIIRIIKMLLVGLATAVVAVTSHADTKLQFALDWKFEGPSAPYFLAIDNGHFKAAGMEVEISPGKVLLMLSQKLLPEPFLWVLLISIR